ncbi:MAG: hypothetical protein M3065_11715 [Actinomycetota bacterium]|nr:hypothetical protein [Actinomycetota bacterium]
MTDDRSENIESQSLMRALLAPLRAPQRVVGNIETIASALLGLQRDVQERLAAVDERLSSVDKRVGTLLAPLNRLDRRVAELHTIERAMTEQTDAIRKEMNTHMLAVEEEVRGMRSPIEKMSRDLAAVVELLPEPSDSPLARLKDTLTSS